MAVRLALIASVVYMSIGLMRPVAPLIIWAIILAVAVYPVFAALRRRMRLHHGLAAALLSVLLLVLLLTPVVILSASAIETLDAYARLLVGGKQVMPPPPELVRDWPLVGARLYDFWLNASHDIRALLSTHVGQIASVGRWVGALAAGVFFEVLQFAGAIIVSGVLLAYSDRLTTTVSDLAGRVADASGRHFIEIAGSTIRNVSQGVIGVALLQSALIGIGMLVAGVPFAGAITFACLVLAIVQVGPNIVMISGDHMGMDIPARPAGRDLHRLHGAVAAARQRAAADTDGAGPADADGRDHRRRDLRHPGRWPDRSVHRSGRAGGVLRSADRLGGVRGEE